MGDMQLGWNRNIRALMCTCMPEAEYYAMKNNGQEMPVIILCHCSVLFLFLTEYLVHFSGFSCTIVYKPKCQF